MPLKSRNPASPGHNNTVRTTEIPVRVIHRMAEATGITAAAVPVSIVISIVVTMNNDEASEVVLTTDVIDKKRVSRFF